MTMWLRYLPVLLVMLCSVLSFFSLHPRAHAPSHTGINPVSPLPPPSPLPKTPVPPLVIPAMASTADAPNVVVNKQHRLPDTYVPQDLVIPRIAFSFKEDHPKKMLRLEAAQAVELLFNGAKKAGLTLYGVSGYRSYDTQKAIHAKNVRTKGEAYTAMHSAEAGASEHQTGLALDVTCEAVDWQLTPAFATTPEGQWLQQHAPAYGFIIRYPPEKQAVTGYTYEPWHIRYVGVRLAQHVRDTGLALDELLDHTAPHKALR